MRKAEMSPQQLHVRTLIVESLLAAGWTVPTNENEMFDQGLWVQCEAFMKFAGPEVTLAITYRADQNAMYLSFDMSDERSVEIKIDLNARPEEVLRVITSFQDKLTDSNYRDHIRSLMAVSGPLYVMVEGEKFVRLTDDKDPVKT
jgi:hypothetical protein